MLKVIRVSDGEHVKVRDLLADTSVSKYIINDCVFNVIDGELWHNSLGIAIPETCSFKLSRNRDGVALINFSKEDLVMLKLALK